MIGGIFFNFMRQIIDRTDFRLQEECGVAMYIDLHAHSRKHNIFIYGCESRKNSDKRLQEQVFPLMLHKNAADKVKKIKSIHNNDGSFRVWVINTKLRVPVLIRKLQV